MMKDYLKMLFVQRVEKKLYGLVIVGVFMSILSCQTKDKESIKGKWMIKEVIYDNSGQTLGEETNQDSYFSFQEENVLEVYNGLNMISGRWELKGDTLKFLTPGGVDYLTIDYHEKDSLILVKNLGNEALQFRLKRIDE